MKTANKKKGIDERLGRRLNELRRDSEIAGAMEDQTQVRKEKIMRKERVGEG